MAEIKNFKNLTYQKTLEIISKKLNGSGTRERLLAEIGTEMYNRMCALGYITQGATIDKNNKRIRVWKLTNKPNLFNDMDNEPTSEEYHFGQLLVELGA